MISSINSPAGSVGRNKIHPNQEISSSSSNNVMTMGSGQHLVAAQQQVDRNTIGGAASISPTDGSTNSDKESGTATTLNVNNILHEADNAAIAAQTIAVAPGTMTGSTNGNNTVNNLIHNNNAAAAAAAVAASATAASDNANTKLQNPAAALNQHVLASAAGVPTSYNTPPVAVSSAPAVDPNNATATTQHLQSAILQQNAAIMQQNAATIQHLQNLHQTNKMLASNPETMGMLAPIMNMTNPAQLLAPGLSQTFAPSNLMDMNGALAAAATPTPTPISTQQQQQQQAIPIPAAQLGAIDPNNNDAVQNFLRTAFMLQNSGLPLAGIIPQQQQQQQQALLSAATASPGIMLMPNSANPFGIVPMDNGNNNSKNEKSKGDNSAAAAAAANAAASVLPLASMNLPLQQQLQQQPSLTPMGIDLSNHNNNNAIALLGGAPLSANNLVTLQQQQQQLLQQRNQQTMFFNMADGTGQQLSMLAPQPAHKSQQQLVVSNPAIAATPTQLTAQQPTAAQKEKPSISRPLYLDHDSNCLTAYQCFLRKQIELFEVGHDEMTGTAQGRNTPLQYGQVGIRCRHCSHLPKSARARGGVYYSRTIDGVYQVAQNMSKLHFLKACTLIPENTKNQLKSLQSVSSRASGGKEYWAEGLRVLGIVEDGGMLRFASSTPAPSSKSGE